MKKAKIVLVGDAGVGKTCIAQRLAKNTFSNSTTATVGAANLTVEVKTKKQRVELSIWDTAGQERYRSLTPMYFACSQVAIVVFDVTSAQSFQAINEFVELLDQKAPSDCISVLVGNKIDLKDKRVVTKEEAESLCSNIGSIFYRETSAATGEGVQQLFEELVDSGMIPFKADDNDYVTDFTQTKRPGNKGGCC